MMPTYSGKNFEKCDCCSRFGAKKYVDDKGANGRGGRATETRWMCDRCEAAYRRELTTKAKIQ